MPRPTHAALRLAHLGLRAWWALARPHTRGVKVVLRRDDGAVLFVRHTYGDRAVWELPGGGLRRREAPQDGAAREAREELGLDLACRGLALVETGGDGKTTTIHVFTAALPAGGEVEPDGGELAEVRWAPPSAPPARSGATRHPCSGCSRVRAHAPRDLLDRRPRPAHRPARRRGAVALVRRGADRPLGAGRGRRGLHAVGGRARLRAARARPRSPAARAPATRSTRCSPATSWPATARSRSSTPAAASPRTPARAASRTPATSPGDGFSAQANMMASPDVWPAMARAFETAVGPLSRRLLAALHAAEARGRRRPRAPVGGARRRARRGRAVADASSTCASTTTPSRWPSSTGCTTSPTPTSWPRRATSSRARAATRRPATATRRASAPRAGQPRAALLGRPLGRPAGDLPTALERVRRAIELQPGWRDLLDRLEPDIAPGAPVVREALDQAGRV